MTDKAGLMSIDELLAALDPKRGYLSVEQLMRSLPAVYRERDQHKHLEAYMGAIGLVFDRVRGTLDQRLRDISPLTCQGWLLPYFAELLDVRPVSRSIPGQRREIAKAVHWRQRKGTLAACVEIAEAVAQMPVIAAEGHLGVATTPIIGRRQPSMAELGEPWVHESTEPSLLVPSQLAERPGTPAVTVDFRKRSLPRQVPENEPTPRSLTSRFGDQEIHWQPDAGPFGVPPQAYPSYRDVCVRTVDTRSPAWNQGHHHPKRLRLFTPVPEGFIIDEGQTIPSSVIQWFLEPWEPGPEHPAWVDDYAWRADTTVVDSKTFLRIDECWQGEEAPSYRSTLMSLAPGQSNLPARPSDGSSWTKPVDDTLFSLCLRRWRGQTNGGTWHTHLRGGTWRLSEGQPGRTGLPVEGRPHLVHEPIWPAIEGTLDIERPAAGLAHHVRVEQLVVHELTAESEALELAHLAARTVSSSHVHARDSLIGGFQGKLDRIDLEHCTLVEIPECERLRASDSILLGDAAAVQALRLRYCCAPRLERSYGPKWIVHEPTVVRRVPELYHQIVGGPDSRTLDFRKFGERGFGVLRLSTHPSIRQGAEDGGELGAFHHRQYCARQDAILTKLSSFLPVGIAPVLTVDPTWQPPQPQKDEQ